MGQIGQLLMPALYGSFQQGMKNGEERKRRNTLSQYVQPALGGDQGALSQIYGVDPDAGIRVQQQATAQAQQAKQFADQDMERLGRHARMITAMADAGDIEGAKNLYKTIYPEASKILGSNLPSDLDPSMLPHMKQIAEAVDPQSKADYLKGQPGDTFIDPRTGKPAFSIPAAAPKEPDSIRELRLLQQNPDLLGVKERLAAAGRAPASEGGKASDWQVMQQQDGTLVRVNKLSGEVAPVTLGNKPVAGKSSASGGQVIQNPDGSTTIIPGGKPNTQELNNVGFYQRMVRADQELDGITGKGYDPTNIKDNATVGRTLTNWLASDEGQQYHQAAMNWIRANLRKESGAAIGKEEAAQEYANYFPQVGDSKDVIAQKARNRKVVEEAMRTATGPALGRQSQSNQAAASNDADPLGIL